MERLELHIRAADRVFYEGACESVVVPTVHGQYGIQAHHSNLIAPIVPGSLEFQPADGARRVAAVSAGMVKVENNQVLVLADAVERPEDIDAVRARREADEAREAMLQKNSLREYHTAKAALARAVNRLRVKEQQGLMGK